MGGAGLLGFHDGKEGRAAEHDCIHLRKEEVLLGGVAQLETALWVYMRSTLNEDTLLVMDGVCE